MQSAALYRDLGTFMARIDRAWVGFDHPALHRTHTWDLRCLPDVYRSLKADIAPLPTVNM